MTRREKYIAELKPDDVIYFSDNKGNKGGTPFYFVALMWPSVIYAAIKVRGNSSGQYTLIMPQEKIHYEAPKATPGVVYCYRELYDVPLSRFVGTPDGQLRCVVTADGCGPRKPMDLIEFDPGYFIVANDQCST